MNNVEPNKDTASSSSKIGEVIALNSKGEGIVEITKTGKRYVVKQVYPKETLLLHKSSTKRKKQSKKAYATKLLWSPYKKIMPPCAHFGVCGGCNMQELPYSTQLTIKEEQVAVLLAPLLTANSAVVATYLGIQTGAQYFYRNKVEYTFGAKKWLDSLDILDKQDRAIEHRALGFHVQGFYDKVVDLRQCLIHPSNDIRKAVHNWALTRNIEYYNSRAHLGVLRTLTVRNNLKGEYMLILSLSEAHNELIEDFVEYVSTRFTKVASIYVAINHSSNESLSSLEYQHKYGATYLLEQCGHIQLKIYPEVFYQTNSMLTVTLYQQIVEMAELNPDDRVLDLYCGIGSIGLFLAHRVQHVLGIESVAQATVLAEENAKRNAINNISFIAGKLETLLRDTNFMLYQESYEVTILDPPRAGLHPVVVKYLLASQCAKIVYVSCNPTSLARDIEMLSGMYELERWQLVDMFPHTHHIETIALLRKKQKD